MFAELSVASYINAILDPVTVKEGNGTQSGGFEEGYSVVHPHVLSYLEHLAAEPLGRVISLPFKKKSEDVRVPVLNPKFSIVPKRKKRKPMSTENPVNMSFF